MVFVLFIVVTRFACISLFISVIVNAMTEKHRVETHTIREAIQDSGETESAVSVKPIEGLQTQLDEIKILTRRRTIRLPTESARTGLRDRVVEKAI